MKKVIFALAALLSSVSLVSAQKIVGTPSKGNVSIVSVNPTVGGACTDPGYIVVNWLGGAAFQCGAPANANLTLPFTNTWKQIAGSPGFTPGIGTAIASAATVAPTSQITHITGTTTISTITPPTGIASGSTITFIYDGVAAWNNAGNIQVAGTPTTAGSTVTFVWDAATSKWYPSRLS